MPCERVEICNDLQPLRNVIEWEEHTARKHEHEVQHVDHRVVKIVSLDAQCEDREKEKPSSGADHICDQQKNDVLHPHVNVQRKHADRRGEQRLNTCDTRAEQNFSDQKFSARHRITEKLIEDSIVAIHEEAIRRVDRNTEARHRKHARKKE